MAGSTWQNFPFGNADQAKIMEIVARCPPLTLWRIGLLAYTAHSSDAPAFSNGAI